MIQRLQTILLALAAIVNIAILFTPIWDVENRETEQVYFIQGTTTHHQEFDENRPVGESKWKDTFISFTEKPIHILFVLACAVVSGLILFTITRFRNRPLQIRLAYGAIAGLFLQILLVIFLTKHYEGIVRTEDLMDESNFVSQFKFGFLMHIPVILLTFWGIMRIKKDEKLVKDSSRLR